MQQQKNEITLQSNQTSLPSLTQRGVAIRDKYGDFNQQFMLTFTPSNRDNYPTLRNATDSDTPTLVDIDLAYGTGSAVMWLYTQLVEVLAFTGLRDNMTNSQIEATAQRIRTIGYHVTVAEMMQFFSRFEEGRYSVFHGYNNPNPQVLMQSFIAFMEELLEVRSESFMAEESRRREQENEEAKRNAVPCPPELAERIRKRGLVVHPLYTPMEERKIDRLV